MEIGNIYQRTSDLITADLGFCLNCTHFQSNEAHERIKRVHGQTQKEWKLPVKALKCAKGVPCDLCMNLLGYH